MALCSHNLLLQALTDAANTVGIQEQPHEGLGDGWFDYFKKMQAYRVEACIGIVSTTRHQHKIPAAAACRMRESLKSNQDIVGLKPTMLHCNGREARG